MRLSGTRRRVAVFTAGAVALATAGTLGLVAVAGPASADTPAPASPTAVTVKGGSTTSVSAPGLAKQLLAKGIVPLPVKGAKLGSVGGKNLNDLTVSFVLPITGGTLDPAAFLAGNIQHSGGLQFVNLARFRSVTISDFNVINGAAPHLEATLNGRSKINLFTLDLSGLQLGGKAGEFDLDNVGLKITDEGAQALNHGLGATVFTAGQTFATGNTVVQY